jgi:TRAP-type mannitol/chloroaromatic compound transport system permease small subunit
VDALLKLSLLIDAVNRRLGKVANWCVLLACLISAGNAMMRYAFDMSSNAWLEIQWYLFAAVVMLGAAYTLERNEHVRVDIFYMQLSERRQLWIDLLGTLFFLIPACLFIAWLSWPFFHESWRLNEISAQRRRPVAPAGQVPHSARLHLVALQGVSEIIKRAGALRGYTRYATHYERPVQ